MKIQRILFKFERPRLKNEVDAELQFHFDQLVEQLKADGLDDSNAFVKARTQFGDLAEIQQECLRLCLQATHTARWLIRFLIVVFCSGVGFRLFGEDVNELQIGFMLMVIGLSGCLLVLIRASGPEHLRQEDVTSSPLGLASTAK